MTLFIFKLILLLALAATWASASLVINELDVASGGYPANEFIELKNAGNSTINTAGWQLALYAFDAGTGAVELVDTQTLVDFDLGPGDYYVLCIYPERVLLCTQEVKTRSDGTAVLLNWVPSQNATVVLLDPAENRADMVGYGSPATGLGLGSAWYEGCGAAPADSATWVGSAIARWPEGDDTDDNAADFEHRCRTPGLTNAYAAVASESCASPGDTNLVINEVDYTQGGGDDTREFIEFHNRGFVGIASTVAGGYRLRILDSANATVRNVSLSGRDFPFVVPVHGYYTLCTALSGVCEGHGARLVDTPATTTNGYIDATTNWIPNPGDGGHAFYTIQLLRQTGSLITVQDTVTYGGGSLSGYTPGTGVADLDASGTNRLGISRWPDGYDTKDNSIDWSARCITPGRENTNSAASCVEPSPTTTPSPTRSRSPTPSRSPSRSPTGSTTPSRSGTPSPSPSRSGSPSPTRTPSASRTPLWSASPSRTPPASPTKTPTASPSSSRTRTPSPTRTPSTSPTRSPTRTPTRSPTRTPTRSPTRSPSRTPSASPSGQVLPG